MCFFFYGLVCAVAIQLWSVISQKLFVVQTNMTIRFGHGFGFDSMFRRLVTRRSGSRVDRDAALQQHRRAR